MFLLCSLRRFKLLHLQSTNTHINTLKQTHKTNSKNNRTTEKTEISQPEPERYLFAVGSRAGYTVFLLFMIFFEFLCCCFCFCLFVLCFRLVFLSVCIYNRQNTYTNMKKTKHINTRRNNQKNISNINLPAETWEISIRGRVEGWIYRIVCFCLNVVLV